MSGYSIYTDMLDRAEIAPAPMLPRRFRVAAKRRQTADTVTLGLEPIDGEPLRFRPGQFDMLYAFGVGEAPISFSGARGARVEHTIRAVGAVTRALCAARRGAVLGLRGPFGTGWDLESAEGADLVIAGGGIGLAPLKPVVEAIIARRKRYGRVAVLVGARSPDLLLFRRELERWRGRFDMDVAISVDGATPDWRGNVGLITDLIPRARFDPGSAVAMLCGPEVMMRFVAAALGDRGLNPSSIHVSMERNMRCAIGHCGHCQFGPTFVCKEGPVYPYEIVARLMAIREI
ncbi:MAG: FAD/NAD(P)-binding protein [Actinomycetota bacterium]